MRFDELDLEDEILDGLEDMNFHEMTPVQEHTIPVILDGRDIIGCAQTGTGKTAAYTLPLLNRLLLEGNEKKRREIGHYRTHARVGTADRHAVPGLFLLYARFYRRNLRGGERPRLGPAEARPAMGADVVIATPGRLISHLTNSRVDLSHVDYLILDEADRMLDMGFTTTLCRSSPICPNRDRR